jgi:hypothetical protein
LAADLRRCVAGPAVVPCTAAAVPSARAGVNSAPTAPGAGAAWAPLRELEGSWVLPAAWLLAAVRSEGPEAPLLALPPLYAMVLVALPSLPTVPLPPLTAAGAAPAALAAPLTLGAGWIEGCCMPSAPGW